MKAKMRQLAKECLDMNAYRVVGRVAVAVLALAGIGAVWQTIAGRRDQRRFPAPGRLIDVGGHRLHSTWRENRAQRRR
jgi:hypothetical protein